MSKAQEKTRFERLIPDITTLIDGTLSKKIKEKELSAEEIYIHEKILKKLELDSEAGKTSGNLGLEELKRLQELSREQGFSIIFAGKDNRYIPYNALAKELNELTTALAWEKGGILATSDKLLAKIAQAKAVEVFQIENDKDFKKIKLEEFFDKETMSVHLREGMKPMAKKGKPGDWEFKEISNKKLTAETIKGLSTEIIEAAHMRTDGFVEIEREGSTIIQLGQYRIVLLRPPLADGLEITAVRPVKRLTIEEYKLSEKLLERIEGQAEGILISGSPGHGKTTFAQALAVFYANRGKIVKTVEAPRDLILPDDITQLSISRGSPEEIHDILLLSRPDYTLFDEMRNTQDFLLYSDLRLAGVGMVGVVHGTSPIDSIQRFIGRIELGVIPHVLDTVVFIKNGKVDTVLAVEMKVKVPAGMAEADLARPVVVVSDFETGKPYAEIYTYGEETVVIPVTKEDKQKGMFALAEKQIEKAFERYSEKVEVETISPEKAIVRVPEKYISAIIGREGKNIAKIEEKLGIGIDIRALENYKETPTGKSAQYTIKESSKTISFDLRGRHFGKDIDIYVGDDYIATFAVGKKGIKIKKQSALGRIILTAIREGEKIDLKVKK
ncbi:MAG TPA: ATPase [Candidatus Woesearchaeota archaeon]|nr:MAG: ATPase [Candidatus Woesearchaeota archaeon]HDD70619.1 ATPase [Candidatus Woesearchaeota archaeon]